jgi:hypothetical protein
MQSSVFVGESRLAATSFEARSSAGDGYIGDACADGRRNAERIVTDVQILTYGFIFFS